MIKCTGEGVPFVEAISDCKISDIGNVFGHDFNLHQLIHIEEEAENIFDLPFLTVQVTEFRCGGIIIGLTESHFLTDGKSLADFLFSWGEIARGLPLSNPPFLDRSIFAPRKPILADMRHPEFSQTNKNASPHRNNEPLIYRSFRFQPEKLVELKKIAIDTELDTTPTSFEVISAFKIKPNEETRLHVFVDVRPKLKSMSIPNGYFGNGIVVTCAHCKAGALTKNSFSFAVKTVHEAIAKVNEEFIRSFIDYYEVTRREFETENSFNITKWGSLSWYDTDFGFGKPTQVAPALLIKSLVVVVPQWKFSKNLCVSLSLPESTMGIFEKLIMLLELKQKL